MTYLSAAQALAAEKKAAQASTCDFNDTMVMSGRVSNPNFVVCSKEVGVLLGTICSQPFASIFIYGVHRSGKSPTKLTRIAKVLGRCDVERVQHEACRYDGAAVIFTASS